MPADKAPFASLSENAELKASVRQDYETSDASLRALAQRYGIRSENTVRRWRAEGNWKRNVGAIAATLTTRAVATGIIADDQDKPFTGKSAAVPLGDAASLLGPGVGVDPRVTAQLRRDRKGAAIVPHVRTGRVRTSGTDTDGRIVSREGPETIEYSPIPGDPDLCAPGTAHKSRRGAHRSAHDDADDAGSGKPASHRSVKARREALEVADRIELSTARDLAYIHSRALQRQNALAELAMATGEDMLAHVRVVMSDADVVVRGESVQALTAINIDKDTVAGITKAAIALIKDGIAVQRKALGMDLIPDAGDKGRGGADTEAAARQSYDRIMASLPPEVLAKIREQLRERAIARPDAGFASEAAATRAKARGSLLPPSEQPEPASTPPGAAPGAAP